MSACGRVSSAAAVVAAAGFAVNSLANPLQLIDVAGNSSLSSGVFTFNGVLSTPIMGSEAFLDTNRDGTSDQPIALQYDNSALGLAGDFFLLHLQAAATTAFCPSGPMGGTYDWALTGYDDFVLGGGPLNPTGSALYGSASFEAGRTILHISEGLLWSDSLSAGEWAGYRLDGLTAFELTQSTAGEFTLTVVPGPSALTALAGLTLLGGRGRKRRG